MAVSCKWPNSENEVNVRGDIYLCKFTKQARIV
jgi:hypothetical protein